MATPRQLEVDQSLLKCVGKLSQLGGISHFTHADGNMQMERREDFLLRIRTARGLELWVLPDKGMDICEASYRGSSLSWHSAKRHRPSVLLQQPRYGVAQNLRWWVALHVWANHRRFSLGRQRSTIGPARFDF
jgi:hypothetical protein